MTPSPVSGSSAAPPATSPTTTPTTPALDKNMFLQLLVAQLKNQDPSKPTDSMQFVQQLAQFQQLEQSVNTGQDISAMRQDMDKLVAPATGQTSPS